MCVIVRDTWKNDSQTLEGKKLDLLESTYIKYHTYLALALHNAVQHNNANYCKLKMNFLNKFVKNLLHMLLIILFTVTGLTSVFNCNMPTT